MSSKITLSTYGWVVDERCNEFGFDTSKYIYDFCFEVSISWLIDKFNINDLDEWRDEYTYDDSFEVYKAALNDRAASGI